MAMTEAGELPAPARGPTTATTATTATTSATASATATTSATAMPATPATPTPTGERPPAGDLPVAIIGAGMGGLATALCLAQKGFRNIQVYESASNLGFVGAGIQLAPNAVRILTRLGCWEDIEPEAIEVRQASIRNGQTGEELAHVQMPDLREKYGYPHCTAHRSTLAGGLYERCRQYEGISFHFGQVLQSVDGFTPTPRFTMAARGEGARPYRLSCSVLIAADGVKSVARAWLLAQTGRAAAVEDTGQAAYRVMLPRERMQHDPDMMALLDSNQVTRWIGERRHWICYPIASRTVYNMSSIQPDVNFAAAPSSTYTTRGSKAAMLDVFSDFAPVLRRMLDLVPEGDVCEWKLRAHGALPAWVHGCVALVGDACHPSLPHLNQGAAMAVEDAAALAEVLARAPDARPDTLNRCLRVYELVRKERCSHMVELAALTGRILHLGDGEAKRERDRQFADAKARGGRLPLPDKWASPEVQDMIFTHDCMKVAAESFQHLYDGLAAQDGLA